MKNIHFNSFSDTGTFVYQPVLQISNAVQNPQYPAMCFSSWKTSF